MNNPKFSIIVPVYNAEATIGRTIDILKEAMAKNKPLEQVPEDMWKLIEF